MLDLASLFGPPENLRINASLTRIVEWLGALSEDDFAVIRAVALTFLPQPIAYPDVTSEQDRLIQWLRCGEDKGWDPAWTLIIARVTAFANALDKGLPFPLEGGLDVSRQKADGTLQVLYPDEATLPASHVAAWEKLCGTWADLRSAELSTDYLLAGMTDVSMPLGAALHGASPEHAEPKDIAAVVTGDPVESLVSLSAALDDESATRLFKPLLDMIPLPLQPPPERDAQLDCLRSWLIADDVSEAAMRKCVRFNRFSYILTSAERALRPRFSGREFDRMVETADRIKAGDIPDWISNTRQLDEAVFEGMKQMMLSGAEAAGDLRKVCAKAGQQWDSLLAGDFEPERLRAWCLAA